MRDSMTQWFDSHYLEDFPIPAGSRVLQTVETLQPAGLMNLDGEVGCDSRGSR